MYWNILDHSGNILQRVGSAKAAKALVREKNWADPKIRAGVKGQYLAQPVIEKSEK